MKTLETYSPINGQAIPVNPTIAEKLNVKPLIYMGKTISTPSGVVMDDRWIYVHCKGYGDRAINVYRANYCQKMYLSEITIQDSIGVNKKMDSELKLFVEKVSDKLVFEKFGKWYRIFLAKKTNRTFGIKKIALYSWTIDPNQQHNGIFNYELAIDWRKKFYVR